LTDSERPGGSPMWNRSFRLRAVTFLFIACTLQHVGCCRTEGRPFPEHYSFGLDFVLAVTEITVNGSSVALRRGEVARTLGGACGETGLIQICVNPGVEEIDVQLRNNSKADAAIIWSKATFLDESGIPHPVQTLPRDATPPDSLIFPERVLTVPSRWSAADSVWPSGKVYYASVNCENAYIMYEPLIPGSLTGTRDGDKAVIQNAADNRTTVFLSFPVAIGDNTLTVRVEMGLTTQDEAYRSYLTEAGQGSHLRF
jgi:hypothetical protein